jgi:hypothetical protein
VLSQQQPPDHIENFKTKFFWLRPKLDITKVNVGLDSKGKGMKVMAFGFIDDDLRNDLVTISHE